MIKEIACWIVAMFSVVSCASNLAAGQDSNRSLYVDDAGRVGIGTDSPVINLHIQGGDSPAIRFGQDASSSFPVQAWDIGGNDDGFFVRDQTNGSTLPFRIEPGAPTASLFIGSDGDIGIGTANPQVDSVFHIARDGFVIPTFESTDGNAIQFLLKSDSINRRFLAVDNSDTTQSQIIFLDDGAFQFIGETTIDKRMEIDASGNLTVEGNLVTGGSGNCASPNPPCDGVFTEYPVESIGDHADYMWANSHLWGIGATPEGEPMDLTRKVAGLIHELEKAHIYIEQLSKRLDSLEKQ